MHAKKLVTATLVALLLALALRFLPRTTPAPAPLTPTAPLTSGSAAPTRVALPDANRDTANDAPRPEPAATADATDSVFVSGEVVDEAGRSVGEVAIWGHLDGTAPVIGLTARDGRFRLALDASAWRRSPTFTVRAAGPDGAAVRSWWTSGLRDPEIELGAIGLEPSADLVLVVGRDLADHETCIEARVIPVDAGVAEVPCVLDPARGTLVATGLPLGAHLVVATDHGSISARPVMLTRAGETTIVLDFAPPRTVPVRILSSTSRAALAADVRLQVRVPNRFGSSRWIDLAAGAPARGDHTGLVVLTAPPVDGPEARIVASAAGHRERRVDLPVGDLDLPLQVIALDRVAATVWVVDPAGHVPAPGPVTVRPTNGAAPDTTLLSGELRDRRVTVVTRSSTTPRGVFLLGAGDGSWAWAAASSRGMPTTITFERPAPGRRLRLVAPDGRPHPDWLVRARIGGSFGEAELEVRSDADGAASFGPWPEVASCAFSGAPPRAASALVALEPDLPDAAGVERCEVPEPRTITLEIAAEGQDRLPGDLEVRTELGALEIAARHPELATVALRVWGVSPEDELRGRVSARDHLRSDFAVAPGTDRTRVVLVRLRTVDVLVSGAGDAIERRIELQRWDDAAGTWEAGRVAGRHRIGATTVRFSGVAPDRVRAFDSVTRVAGGEIDLAGVLRGGEVAIELERLVEVRGILRAPVDPLLRLVAEAADGDETRFARRFVAVTAGGAFTLQRPHGLAVRLSLDHPLLRLADGAVRVEPERTRVELDVEELPWAELVLDGATASFPSLPVWSIAAGGGGLRRRDAVPRSGRYRLALVTGERDAVCAPPGYRPVRLPSIGPGAVVPILLEPGLELLVEGRGDARAAVFGAAGLPWMRRAHGPLAAGVRVSGLAPGAVRVEIDRGPSRAAVVRQLELTAPTTRLSIE